MKLIEELLKKHTIDNQRVTVIMQKIIA